MAQPSRQLTVILVCLLCFCLACLAPGPLAVYGANGAGNSHYELAGRYMSSRNNLHKALSSIERALAIEPENANYLVRKAEIVYEISEDEKTSFGLLDKALKLSPRNRQALTLKAKLAAQRGDQDLAVSTARLLYEGAPADADARIAYGRALVGAGKYIEGAQILEPVLKEQPRNPAVLDLMALVDEKMQNWTRAISHLNGLLEVLHGTPYARSELIARRSLAYERLGKTDLALSGLREAVKLGPTNHKFRLELISILKKTGDIAGAQKEETALKKLEADMLPF